MHLFLLYRTTYLEWLGPQKCRQNRSPDGSLQKSTMSCLLSITCQKHLYNSPNMVVFLTSIVCILVEVVVQRRVAELDGIFTTLVIKKELETLVEWDIHPEIPRQHQELVVIHLHRLRLHLKLICSQQLQKNRKLVNQLVKIMMNWTWQMLSMHKGDRMDLWMLWGRS